MMVCRFRKRFVFAEPKFGFEAVGASLIPLGRGSTDARRWNV